MTKAEFSKSLIDMGFTVTTYNSNNVWGFGGVRGELFVKDQIKVLIGLAGTRHRGTFPVLTVTVNGERLQDTDYGKRNLEKAYKIIQDATN